MPPKPPPAPKAPTGSRPLFTLYLGVGVFFFAAGLLFLVVGFGSMAPGVGFIAFGSLFAFLGAWGRRMGAGAQLINRSLNLIAQGKLAEAEQLLAQAEKTTRAASHRRAIHVQRASIAIRRGDVDGALASIERANASTARLRGKVIDTAQACNVRAIRAFLRATKGEAEGAREDIGYIRKTASAPPTALGCAAVAEAILLERAGDKAALRELLDRERTVLLEGTSPRERAIVRAFQRMLRAPTTSVYRKSAPREPEGAAGEEPAVADWVAKIVPSAAPFVQAPKVTAKRGEEAAEPLTAEGAEALKTSRAALAAKGKKLFWKGAGKRLFLLALGTAIFLAVVLLWAGSPDAPVPVPLPDDLPFDPVLAAGRIAAAVAFAGLGVIFYSAFRARRHIVMLQRAWIGAVRGDPAAIAALREVAAGGFDTIAAQAYLLLARVADRRGDPAEALAQVEQGLSRLSRYASRVAAAELVLPELSAERAYFLAAAGRDAEAAAELAALNPAYPFLARARYRVRLMTLVRRGDLAGAARLAEGRDLDLPLSPRDELLGDAVRVAVSPETSGAGEVARVKDELKTQPDLRRWMAAVAPAVLRGAELASEAEDDDAGDAQAAARQAEAEREARAEAEALAEAAPGPARTFS
jgi:hypothetical protein